MRSWNRDYPPYKVIGNIYYVGSNAIAQFLITTPAGHILLDSGFEASVPRLRAGVESLGFRFADIKILLTSHAHIDHVQGHATVRRLTGARWWRRSPTRASSPRAARARPSSTASTPGRPAPSIGPSSTATPSRSGDTTLVAHVTPGHTMGATTWTMRVVEDGRPLDVVFFPSANVNRGVRLVGNPRYPQIAEDFARSFATWRALPCDVFLGVHGDFYDMEPKRRRLERGGPNPFIDPDGYRRFVAEAESRFRAQLASER